MWLRRVGVVTACACLAACGTGADDGVGGAAGADGPAPPEAPPSTTAGVLADDIPVAHTPPGGWTEPPAPVLADCTEPLADGAPDMRGLWRAVDASRDGVALPSDHPSRGNVQRIEQCGDRVVITSAGIVHDMRADGTVENGVHDVAEADRRTPITVVASFEDGAHVLRPVGVPATVVRRLDGDRLVWDYVGTMVVLERIGGPTDPFPGREGSR